MTDPTSEIRLFHGDHAIEVVTFTILLASPIDRSDAARFEQKKGEIQVLFPSIRTPQYLDISFGNQQNVQNAVPPKELTYFAPNGTPQWTAVLDSNLISVTCRDYTSWEEVWPKANDRLRTLLDCLDNLKYVQAMEYAVVDTLSVDTNDSSPLLPNTIFRRTDKIPEWLFEYEDSRWDFSQGWYTKSEPNTHMLVRFEARGGVKNSDTFVSINNLHSFRTGTQPRPLSDCLDNNSAFSLETFFDKAHKLNKDILIDVLEPKLLTRMGLQSGEQCYDD